MSRNGWYSWLAGAVRTVARLTLFNVEESQVCNIRLFRISSSRRFGYVAMKEWASQPNLVSEILIYQTSGYYNT